MLILFWRYSTIRYESEVDRENTHSPSNYFVKYLFLKPTDKARLNNELLIVGYRRDANKGKLTAVARFEKLTFRA